MRRSIQYNTRRKSFFYQVLSCRLTTASDRDNEPAECRCFILSESVCTCTYAAAHVYCSPPTLRDKVCSSIHAGSLVQQPPHAWFVCVLMGQERILVRVLSKETNYSVSPWNKNVENDNKLFNVKESFFLEGVLIQLQVTPVFSFGLHNLQQEITVNIPAVGSWCFCLLLLKEANTWSSIFVQLTCMKTVNVSTPLA